MYERTKPKERKEKGKKAKMLKLTLFLLLEFALMYYLVEKIPNVIVALIAVFCVSFSYLWIKYLRFFK